MSKVFGKVGVFLWQFKHNYRHSSSQLVNYLVRTGAREGCINERVKHVLVRFS